LWEAVAREALAALLSELRQPAPGARISVIGDHRRHLEILQDQGIRS